MKNKQSFKTAAVSIIAMLTALASARAAERVATTISGTFSENAIYGNHTVGNYTNHNAEPANNTLTFKEAAQYTGSTSLAIYGSYTETAGKKAESNKVVVDKLTSNKQTDIYGGYSDSGAVEMNSATINDGTFSGNYIYIYGGYSDSGAAWKNSATVNNGTFSGDVHIYGGFSDGSGAAKENSATVSGGTFSDETSIYGGQSYSGDATGNSVTINGDDTTFRSDAHIYGGFIYNGSGAAKENSVTINKGTFDDDVDIFGGESSSGAVTGNTVAITGGKFNGSTTVIAGGLSYEGTVEGNKVYLSGGEFAADADNLVAGGKSNTAGAVKNNTVYVYNTVDLANVKLDAAVNSDDDPMKSGGGNTLVFGYDKTPWMSSTGKVSGIYGFDTVKITAATWNKPIIVGYLDTSYAKNGKTTVDATKVAFAGVDSVKKGDKTDLLKAKEVSGDGLVLKSAASKYTVGTTLQGEGTVAIEDNDEGAVVTYAIDSANRSAQPQSHTAAMGMTAGVAAVNQGADTVLATLKNLSDSGHKGLEAFAAMGGGTARQETGSHVTLNAFNFATGLGSNIDVGAGLFTVGGALEAGYGSFKNHFDAGEADPFIKKSGHLHYYGAAATAGMKWNSLWHADGLFRLGYAKSEQAGGLYNPGLGALYDVDIGSYYVGTEIGGGKAFRLNDTNAIDVYARYFYLHKGGDDFYAGGSYDLKAVDSHRLRTGARYDLSLGNRWGFYTGLAYEYEFDGESRLFVDTVEAEAVKTKGGRAYGELGVKLTPEKDAAGLALDFNVKGAAGSKYRDVLFGIDVKYMF